MRQAAEVPLNKSWSEDAASHPQLCREVYSLLTQLKGYERLYSVGCWFLRHSHEARTHAVKESPHSCLKEIMARTRQKNFLFFNIHYIIMNHKCNKDIQRWAGPIWTGSRPPACLYLKDPTALSWGSPTFLPFSSCRIHSDSSIEPKTMAMAEPVRCTSLFHFLLNEIINYQSSMTINRHQYQKIYCSANGHNCTNDLPSKNRFGQSHSPYCGFMCIVHPEKSQVPLWSLWSLCPHVHMHMSFWIHLWFALNIT